MIRVTLGLSWSHLWPTCQINLVRRVFSYSGPWEWSCMPNAFFSCLRTTTVRAIFHSLFYNSLQVVNKNTPPFEIEAAYQVLKQILGLQTSNNQRLRSAGDNDRRSKRFCSSAVLCVSFTWQMVKTRLIRWRVLEYPNARVQSTFCTSHTFLMEVQTNAVYLHAMHAW